MGAVHDVYLFETVPRRLALRRRLTVTSVAAESRAHPSDFLARAAVLRAYLWCVRTAYVISFAVPIVNPAVQGTALYFYIWLPVCDFGFLRWIGEQVIPVRRAAAMAIAGGLFVAALHDLEMSLRFLLVASQIAYLYFLLDRGLLRALSWALLGHVLVAILQLLFFFLPSGVPELLTPTGLSRAIWGQQFAVDTFTNFGFESFLPRVSGLHRESGFFSAFVIGLYLVFSETGYLRGRRWISVALTVGLLASFSKITFAIVLIYILRRLRVVIDRIPVWMAVASFVIACVFVSEYVFGPVGQQALLLGEGTAVSFMHRFLGYHVLASSSWFNMFFGNRIPGAELPGSDTMQYVARLLGNVDGLREYNLYPGLGAILYRGGVVALAALVAFFRISRIRSTAVLVMLVATFSVSLDTLQNFSILLWLFVVLSIRTGRSVGMPDVAASAARDRVNK